MSPPILRKIARKQNCYSVVELNDICHVFASTVPRIEGSFRDQVRDALEAVAEVMEDEDASGAVVQQAVFVGDSKCIPACRQIVREFYGRDLPATNYVVQPPCNGKSLAIEAMGLGHGRDKAKIERISDQVVIVKHDGVAFTYANQAVPRTSAKGVYEKTICAYQQLRRLLPDFRLGRILRLWLHLGGIVDDDGPVQRYKELNRARAEVYQNVRFMSDRLPQESRGLAYPASTGIGTSSRSLSLSALAFFSDKESITAVPLENPRQTAAYSYSKSYSPTSPKFSRGLALCWDDETRLFISGTASITNSESRHPEDAVAQTHETFENIKVLISEDNLSRHQLPGRGTSLAGLAVARVYIKQLEDYDSVRKVCEDRLGRIPVSYVVADVCRPDLLVEVEGMAFSRKTPSGSPNLHSRPCESAGKRSVCEPMEPAPYCPESCPERFQCPHAVLR